MLFVDFRSPVKLIGKLNTLGLSTTLCNWILDFTYRPQAVQIGDHTSSTLVLNTGAPQGCVLRLFLFTLCTHDCNPSNGENSVVKFADDLNIIGRISNNNETSYLLQDGAQRLTYCSTSTKPRSWSSVELRWSKWTVSGSWDSASQWTFNPISSNLHQIGYITYFLPSKNVY